MNNLINKINHWADERNLKQADPKIQWMRVTDEEIKNRNGKMINGTFVKEEDL